jgi:SnoaL-like domain
VAAVRAVESYASGMDEKLLDRFAITDVVNNWVIWSDSGDWERFATVWHDDAWMTSTWFQGPAAEFQKARRDGFERGVSIIHFLGGTTIELRSRKRR